jgi:serine/threonine protein kinase
MALELDGYDHLVLVGQGGLGKVYRATRRSTGGPVAIKQLGDVEAASPAWHRARRELDAMLRLKGHPFVVAVEEIVEAPDGPCIVMEYLPNGSLGDRLVRGALPVGEAVLAGQHVSQALAAAHEVGVVHRDIKPANLLVGGFGQVKVCDFGIASLARGAHGRTQTKALTLGYASPEELDGESTVGPAADVFSFGATMIHLGTGRRPSFAERMSGSKFELGPFGDDPALTGLGRALERSVEVEAAHRPTMVEMVAAFDDAAWRLADRRATRISTDDPEHTTRRPPRMPAPPAPPVAVSVPPVVPGPPTPAGQGWTMSTIAPREGGAGSGSGNVPSWRTDPNFGRGTDGVQQPPAQVPNAMHSIGQTTAPLGTGYDGPAVTAPYAPVPPPRGASRSGLLAAAVAAGLAALIAIGVVVAMLASGGDEVAVESTVIPETEFTTSGTSVPAVAVTLPPETTAVVAPPPAVTAAAMTLPPTLPPVVTLPATLPPVVTSMPPTVPPPSTPFGRTAPPFLLDGDLGIFVPMTEPPCDGSFVVVLVNETNPSRNAATMTSMLDRFPDSGYLRTRGTCTSLRWDLDGNDIYFTYLGPFRSAAEACAARPVFPNEPAEAQPYVRVLDNATPVGTNPC